MIQKSWTKVNFIRCQLDATVLYNKLRSAYKWKSALTGLYVFYVYNAKK